MSFSVEVLAGIAIELQRGIGHQDRFQRLITTLRQVLACDASALLRYESRQFIPLAIDGLAQDVLGRRFTLEGHPRLEAIARAGDVVRFPADSDLPDPYDGLIPGQESLKVHACVGLPLFAGQNLIGALTLDAMTPEQFEVFSDEELRLVAALAAGALSNALLIEQLESQNMLPGSSGVFEPIKETHMIGLSPAMTQLKKEIEIVAGSDLNVLIGGETGTGKELKGLLPGLSVIVAVSSKWRTTVRCFWMRLANCRWRYRPSYFACCSMAIFSASATIVACAWMCGCWRRPTVTCVKRCWRGVFAPICSIA